YLSSTDHNSNLPSNESNSTVAQTKDDISKNDAELSPSEKEMSTNKNFLSPPAPKESSEQIVSENKLPPSTDAPAKEAFVEHEQLLNESKGMTKEANNIKSKINDMPSSHLRDSLI